MRAADSEDKQGSGASPNRGSPISDILNELYLDQPPFASDDPDELIDWQSRAVREAAQAITALLEAAIGEDEPEIWIEELPGVRSIDAGRVFRNKLRHEIRQKLGIPNKETNQ